MLLGNNNVYWIVFLCNRLPLGCIMLIKLVKGGFAARRSLSALGTFEIVLKFFVRKIWKYAENHLSLQRDLSTNTNLKHIMHYETLSD